MMCVTKLLAAALLSLLLLPLAAARTPIAKSAVQCTPLRLTAAAVLRLLSLISDAQDAPLDEFLVSQVAPLQRCHCIRVWHYLQVCV
jgi:hypothetical protein